MGGKNAGKNAGIHSILSDHVYDKIYAKKSRVTTLCIPFQSVRLFLYKNMDLK